MQVPVPVPERQNGINCLEKEKHTGNFLCPQVQAPCALQPTSSPGTGNSLPYLTIALAGLEETGARDMQERKF